MLKQLGSNQLSLNFPDHLVNSFWFTQLSLYNLLVDEASIVHTREEAVPVYMIYMKPVGL